jgi:DNA-binding transcriptional regulator YhcF (GntR family)
MQVMKMLLTDHTQSDAQIAAHVSVARQTVAKVRRSMERAGRIKVWRPRGGRT